MRILLTNDDGINAEGLRNLVKWAKTKGEVTVLAPKTQQSAKSHSIEIHGSYEVKRVDIFDDIEAYSVDSSPADCIRIASLGMKKQFDLVISGINCGHNLGGDIRYSGTVGACYEASKCGFKALALSACFDSFDNAVKNLNRVYDFICDKKIFELADVVNVNFPEVGDEIVITRVGDAIYSDDFEFTNDDIAIPHLICLYKGTSDINIDTDATMTGHISISPLQTELTNFDAYKKLKG